MARMTSIPVQEEFTKLPYSDPPQAAPLLLSAFHLCPLSLCFPLISSPVGLCYLFKATGCCFFFCLSFVLALPHLVRFYFDRRLSGILFLGEYLYPFVQLTLADFIFGDFILNGSPENVNNSSDKANPLLLLYSLIIAPPPPLFLCVC